MDLFASTVTRRLPSSSLTSGARGKIRYVGGYVLAKLRYRHQQAANRRVYKLDVQSRNQLHEESAKVKLLSEACRSESQIIAESEDLESLQETSRRQNIRQSLNHITDTGYVFFAMLTEETIALQNAKNLYKYGENLNHYVIVELCSNERLYSKYRDMFASDFASDLGDLNNQRDVYLKQLYSEAVNLFSRVMVKQLRKDYLAECRKKKKLAHRKNILQSNTASAGPSAAPKTSSRATTRATKRHRSAIEVGKLTYDTLLADDSKTKAESHRLLREYTQQKSKLPNFLKAQLQDLCKSYGLQFVASDTKATLERKLMSAISELDSMPHPHVLGGEAEERHGEKRGGDRRGGSRKTKVTDKCRECRQVYNEDLDSGWIMCDQCTNFFHRECAEIWDDDEWDTYVKTENKFVCHHC